MAEKLRINNQEMEDNLTIKVIGVGGGGGNMLNYMKNKNIPSKIRLIASNTDLQALKTCKADEKIQLGAKLTSGLGAGMKPEIGEKAAEESYEDIKDKIKNTNLLFISAGMGGGTGTGASPIIAKAAKELGLLTIAVVTKPFKFEGNKRNKLALKGIEKIKEYADSILIIPNYKILEVAGKKVGRKEAFNLVDKILYEAVSGIYNMIINYSENDINVDFNDLKTVMSYKGMALMGVGYQKGNNSALKAVEEAINSPLLDEVKIDGAMGVLIHFTMNEKYPLDDIYSAMNVIEEKANPDADIIMGTTTDNSLENDEVRVTLVATGFEKDNKRKKQESIKKVLESSFKKTSSNYSDFNLEDSVSNLDAPAFLRKINIRKLV
jgi:cell division protein FtsZ